MNFSTPAQLFKFYGDLMVVLQGSEPIHEEFKRLVDEFEKSPTTETFQRVDPPIEKLHQALFSLSNTHLSESYKPVPSNFSESLNRQLERFNRKWKRLQTRYSKLAIKTLKRDNAALVAQLEILRKKRKLN